jgi:hypothetical protein
MTRFPSITAIVVTLSLLVFTEVSASPRNHRRRRLSRFDDGTSPADSASISDVYEYCTTGQDSVQNLQCIADTLEKNATLNAEDAHTWFTIYAAALIFFMQAGFAMLCAGSVRLKNVGNTMLKNLLDACGAALGFFSVGYAFAFGGQNDSEATTFIGSSNFFMIGTFKLSRREEKRAFTMAHRYVDVVRLVGASFLVCRQLFVPACIIVGRFDFLIAHKSDAGCHCQ